MGNDANDIEHIAPTPWKPDPDYRGHFLDAKGDMVSRWAVRDRIIARVNAYPELVAMVRELRTAILGAAYTTEQCQRALHRSDTILAKVSNA